MTVIEKADDTPSRLEMKVAVASSGLGHVARGIETWACGEG